jgi:hypothetical protein
MGARQQLNRLALLGCAGVAAAVGVVSNSWVAFAVTLAVTAGAAVANRDIRLGLARRRTARR